MSAVSAHVTDSRGAIASRTLTYTIASKLRIGWSCPINTLPTRVGMYPRVGYVRVFRTAGQSLPAWSQLDPIPKTAVLHLSVKDRGLPVGAWLASRPTSWRTPMVFTLDHEPEQQDSGDPMPAEYWDEWAELCDSLAGHPRRGDIILCPVFTRYAAELGSDRASWYTNFGRVVEIPGVDAVGFDVYNPGSSYQTSAQMFRWVCDFAASHRLPLYIAEWGRERMGADTTGATAGTVCAQYMREDVNYLRSRGVAGVAWFHQGNDHLDTGASGQPRTPERNALAELIQEA